MTDRVKMSRRFSLLACCLALWMAAGCETAPKSAEDKAKLESQAAAAFDRLKATDPSITDKFIKSASAYAVFPTVAKGGLGVGGAFGRGVLYEKGVITGYCSLSQATIGFQLGGQGYTEVIFFQDAKALGDFKDDTLEFAAQASAVAASAGAAANADYQQGVAVFVLGEKGLMYEASIGGQKFNFEPRPRK